MKNHGCFKAKRSGPVFNSTSIGAITDDGKPDLPLLRESGDSLQKDEYSFQRPQFAQEKEIRSIVIHGYGLKVFGADTVVNDKTCRRQCTEALDKHRLCKDRFKNYRIGTLHHETLCRTEYFARKALWRVMNTSAMRRINPHEATSRCRQTRKKAAFCPMTVKDVRCTLTNLPARGHESGNVTDTRHTAKRDPRHAEVAIFFKIAKSAERQSIIRLIGTDNPDPITVARLPARQVADMTKQAAYGRPEKMQDTHLVCMRIFEGHTAPQKYLSRIRIVSPG